MKIVNNNEAKRRLNSELGVRKYSKSFIGNVSFLFHKQQSKLNVERSEPPIIQGFACFYLDSYMVDRIDLNIIIYYAINETILYLGRFRSFRVRTSIVDNLT